MTHFRMMSDLTREEISARLRERIDSPWNFFGDKAVIGSASRDGFWLQVRHTYRNSFQTILSASMSERDNGTLLHCRAGMSWFVIVFLAIWFSGVVLLVLAFLGAFLEGGPVEPVALITLAIAAFGVGLVAFGRWLARDDRDTLVAFLEDIVDARDA